MTFASGAVFPASMKPYRKPAGLPACREYVSIPIRISIYMFYEVWFISPYNTRQCNARQHQPTLELEGRKFDNHGLGALLLNTGRVIRLFLRLTRKLFQQF